MATIANLAQLSAILREIKQLKTQKPELFIIPPKKKNDKKAGFSNITQVEQVKVTKVG